MLILAGVSINAIIGENGIITKAQNSVYVQSIAALQEYLQMEYSNYVLEDNPYGTEYGLLKAKNPDWFYQSAQGYILDSEGHVLYLVRKSGLPEDIKSQLKGGDASTISDYYNQKDVYGVTSDLLVYYCRNGVDSILGLTKDDLQLDSPLEEKYTADSKLAQFINGGTKALTNQDLKKITNLTINKLEDIELVKEFKNLPNLSSVYFKDINGIENLDGISGAVNLTEVKFENCFVKNYSDLGRNKNLNKLYLMLPAGGNLDVENLCSKTVGIGSEDLPNLQYFGVVGFPPTIESLKRTEVIEEFNYSRKHRYNITSIDDFENLTEVTKQSINYLYLNNLQLTSLKDSLIGFSNVQILRCEYNNLVSLSGLEHLNKLTYLFANDQSTKHFGVNEIEEGYNRNVDALSALENINTLKYIDLSNNSQFKWSKYLQNLNNLEYLCLGACTGILDFDKISLIINNLGKNAVYPGSFGSAIIANNSSILNLTNSKITVSDFKKLKENTSLVALNLRNTNITNDDGSELTVEAYNSLINEVLSTCVNMNYLEISYQTKLNNINFVSNMNNLYELNLNGDTSVSDLTILENMALNNTLKLHTLFLSNPDIELATIQNAISKLCNDFWTDDVSMILNETGNYMYRSYWYGDGAKEPDSVFGLILLNSNLAKKLENCTNITNLVWCPGWRNSFGVRLSGELNLSKCLNLKKLYYYYNSHNLILPEKLETLYYGFTDKNTIDFSLCEKLKNIRTFCINKENAYETMFATLPSDFNSLEVLWLQDQNTRSNLTDSAVVYCENLEFFRYFINCNNFKRFVIQQNNTWQTYNFKNFEGLKYATNLENIELNFTINDGGASADFPDLSGLTKLKSLKIKYGNMNLENIKTCTNLQELKINNTFIKNVDFLNNINGLQNVDLSNNQIQSIEGLRGKKNINILKLGNNSLIDISPLKGLNNISYLELNNNKLADFAYDNEGKNYYTLTVLTELNQRGKLRNLCLYGNLFDDYSIITNNKLSFDELILNKE